MADISKVAIILRTKNRPIFVKRAIQSIIGQTFKDWKVYVINDGGDNISNVIKKCVTPEEWEKFVFVDLPFSSGRGGALSIGLNICMEEYVHIHDDDDTLEPDFLERTCQYLENDKNDIFVGVATSNYDVLEELKDDRIVVCEKTDRGGLKVGSIIDYSLYLSHIGVVLPICFLFKRKFLKSVGGVDINMNQMEDYDLFLRLMQYGEIGIISDFLCSYHQRRPTGSVADNSRHEKNYDYHVEYRNNIIRDAIENKSSLKSLQSHFIHGRTINDFHTHHLMVQMNNLTKSFTEMTQILSEILKKK